MQKKTLMVSCINHDRTNHNNCYLVTILTS
jgi:hypothetical protein